MTFRYADLDRRRFTAGLISAAALLPLLPAAARAEIAKREDLLAEMVMGKADAPVTIIAYESMTCPHCASFHANTLPRLKKEYIDTGKVKFVMRDFPFDQVALRAHMMARCSGKDRFFGMVEVLYRSQESWTRAQNPLAALAGVGRMSGLSQADFDACMKHKELFDFIVRRIKEGRDKYGVERTPSFVIAGKLAIVGAQPFDEFEKVLEPLIN